MSLTSINVSLCRDQKYDDLERFTFGLTPSDVEAYESHAQMHASLGVERADNIRDLLHDAIKNDLADAHAKVGSRVANIRRVANKPVYMLFVLACDITDQLGRLRGRLCQQQPQLFAWDADTRLLDVATFRFVAVVPQLIRHRPAPRTVTQSGQATMVIRTIRFQRVRSSAVGLSPH